MTEATPINIQMIDHVVLRVQDMDTMRRFYRDVLGCTLERDRSDIGLAQLRAGQSLIDLVDMNGPLGRQGGDPPDHHAPNMDHFCVQLLPWNAEAIRRHLAEHGIEAPEPVSRYGALGQGPSIYITDPEGNTVELKGPPGPA